jgi:hypothetical protein
MPESDSYGQGINLAVNGDAPNAEQLVSDLEKIIGRTAMIFTNASQRGATLSGTGGAPAPHEGMLTYLLDTDSYEYYNGTAWKGVYEAIPRLPRGRVASKYSTDGLVVGTITTTNLLWEAWCLAVPVLTTRRYRMSASFTWISPIVGMSAKIWIGHVPSAVALPGNGTGATEVAYRIATEPATNCNQVLMCSKDFNGPISGNINVGVYATKYAGPSGGFTVQPDPIELYIEDVGPAV